MQNETDNEIPLRKPQTVAEMEVAGMKLGIEVAQRLIRGYGDNPLRPDNPFDVAAIGQQLVEDAVADGRANCGLNHAGEAAWRKGYERGLASQMKHPNARIDIKVVKP